MNSIDWRLHTLAPSLRGIERVRCVQVGVGGTGSWVARMMAGVHVARRDAQLAGIAFPLWALGGLPWDLVLVDPDRVEEKNVGRQAFGYDAIGAYKAQVLVDDLGRTHRLAYEAHCLPFAPAVLRQEPHTLVVLVGCVDNPAARAFPRHV